MSHTILLLTSIQLINLGDEEHTKRYGPHNKNTTRRRTEIHFCVEEQVVRAEPANVVATRVGIVPASLPRRRLVEIEVAVDAHELHAEQRNATHKHTEHNDELS